MRSMSEYKPPFHIIDKIINPVADISEQIGRINALFHGSMNSHLRKANRIQTIHSPICRWKCTIEIPTTNSGITAANNFISHKYS